jgi:hypothetical protein
MSPLSQDYFERELSPAEEEALAAELAASEEACQAFAAAAADDYKRSGFPDPAGPQPRRLAWAAAALLALGLGYGLSRAPERPVALASVEEKAFEERVTPAAPRPRPAEPREERVAPAVPDRLLAQRDGYGYIFTVFTVEERLSGPGRLELLDLNGRSLRVLYSGPLDPGTWAFRWDGRAGDGQSLQTGRYRLEWSHGAHRLAKTVQVESR